MKEHTDVQIIKQGGRPIFAIVPYDDWLELTHSEPEEIYIPHEVVGLQLKQGLSLIAAWRKYRKLTQVALSKKLGISQPALAQIEKEGSKTKRHTLEKLAAALDVDVEQLMDD